MNNIQSISDSYLCSACGACYAICPKNAIGFDSTNIGRLYAKVNETCINCGLCKKICPSLNKPNDLVEGIDKFVGKILSVYVGKTTDKEIFQNAQSGGIATGILSYLFDNRLIDAAVVCRMTSGNTPKVEPVIVESKEKLLETQKSCYTPVSMLSSLQQASGYKSLALVGLPCHMEGLKLLQSHSGKFSNIKYKIGLICDRVMCTGVQDVIKDYSGLQEFKIVWKRKYDCESGAYNYRLAPITAIPNEGGTKVLPRHYRIALKEMFTPPRCRICWDKLNIFSDITLGDPWRMKDIDMQKGESLIICRSKLGEALLDSMKKVGCLSIRAVDKTTPVYSQHISERRKLVNGYSCSFSVIPQKVNSYLINPENEGSEVYRKILMDFVENENNSRDLMLEKARFEIKQFEEQRKKQNTVNRIIKKIKSLFFK